MRSHEDADHTTTTTTTITDIRTDSSTRPSFARGRASKRSRGAWRSSPQPRRSSARVRRVPLRRTARGPHPQHRRRTDRDPARRRLHPSQPTRRTLGGICRGRGDLHLRVRRRLRGDRSPDRSPPTRLPRSTRARRTSSGSPATNSRPGFACVPAGGSTARHCIADGHHARVDGYVSLGVVASAAVVAMGFEHADPLIGLAITAVILRVTWQAWRTIRDHPGNSGG